jgi:transposase-like protein
LASKCVSLVLEVEIALDGKACSSTEDASVDYASLLDQRMRHHLRHPNRSWRVDETYARVACRWTYLYRALDSEGNTIDFMLSPYRDRTAAKHFLQLALWRAGHLRPRVINVDGPPAYPSAIAELKKAGELQKTCQYRRSLIKQHD